MQMPDSNRVSSNVAMRGVSSSENPTNSNGQSSLRTPKQSEHFSTIFRELADKNKIEEPNSPAIDQPIDRLDPQNKEEAPTGHNLERSKSTGDNLSDEAGGILRQNGNAPKTAVDFQGNATASNISANLSHPRYFQSQFDTSASPRAAQVQEHRQGNDTGQHSPISDTDPEFIGQGGPVSLARSKNGIQSMRVSDETRLNHQLHLVSKAATTKNLNSEKPRAQDDLPPQANGVKTNRGSLHDRSFLQGEGFQRSVGGASQKIGIPEGHSAMPLKSEARRDIHEYKELVRDGRAETVSTSNPTETQKSLSPPNEPGEKDRAISASPSILPQDGVKQPSKTTYPSALQLAVSDSPIGTGHSGPHASLTSTMNQMRDALSPRPSFPTNTPLSDVEKSKLGQSVPKAWNSIEGRADNHPARTGQHPMARYDLTEGQAPLLPNRSDPPEIGAFVARAKAISPAPDLSKSLERKEFSAPAQDDAHGATTSIQSQLQRAKPITLPTLQSPRADQLFDEPISNDQRTGLSDESPDQELTSVQMVVQSRGTSASPQLTAIKTGVPHHIPKQLAEVIHTSGSKSVDVTLSPEELGRVRLSITQAESGLLVNIQAERPETLEMLRRNIEQLDKELQLLGYAEPGFSFSSEGGEPDRAPDKTITSPPPIEEHASASRIPSTADRNLDPKIQSGVDIRL